MSYQSGGCTPGSLNRHMDLLIFSARLLLVSIPLASAPQLLAEANVHPDYSHSWGANIGWVNWRPDPIRGADFGQFICAGYIYSANTGWINLGQGTPANGIRYQNDSASDFGVNMDFMGNLRGLAYGANIGWINFEDKGAPRVDLRTGTLHGHVYSANTGWITLENSTYPLRVDSISSGSDSDRDGIPDAWERLHAGNLATFSATSDTDQDGHSDLEEYMAGTDPLDPLDSLRITHFSAAPGGQARISWSSKIDRHYRVEVRTDLGAGKTWIDSGLGLQSPDGALTSRDISAATPHTFYRIKAVRPLVP
jgi:hypothetical protein